jgi:hypothetical protein
MRSPRNLELHFQNNSHAELAQNMNSYVIAKISYCSETKLLLDFF